MFVNERELDLLDFGTAAERVLGDMRHQSVSKIVAKRSHSQNSAVAIRNQKLVMLTRGPIDRVCQFLNLVQRAQGMFEACVNCPWKNPVSDSKLFYQSKTLKQRRIKKDNFEACQVNCLPSRIAELFFTGMARAPGCRAHGQAGQETRSALTKSPEAGPLRLRLTSTRAGETWLARPELTSSPAAEISAPG